jgi:hypothetical protein
MISLEDQQSSNMAMETHSVPHVLKPKGAAIPGLDYGIDMLDETPAPIPQAGGNQRRPESPNSNSEIEQSNGQSFNQSRSGALNYSRPQNQMQQQRPMSNFQNQAFPQRFQGQQRNDEGSLEEGSYNEQSANGSGSDMQSNGSDDNNLLQDGFMPEGNAADPPQLTYEQRRERKINGLAALRRLEEAGYVAAGDKTFSFASELAEIEETVERLKLQRDLDSSIKFQRKFLIGFSNVVEYVCSTEYNIFDLKLEGWSESLFENITDYDEVFEELYFKYKDSVAVLPEVKLMMMVGGSAMMFHMSRELFSKTSSKVPGFDEVMSRDPDLRRRYTDAASGIAKERGMPMPSKSDNGMGFLNDLVKNAMPSSINMGQARSQPQQTQPVQQTQRPRERVQQQQFKQPQRQQSNRPQMPQGRPAPNRTRIPMSDPDDIDGLLSSLTGKGKKSKTYIEDEIDLSEIENLSDLG